MCKTRKSVDEGEKLWPLLPHSLLLHPLLSAPLKNPWLVGCFLFSIMGHDGLHLAHSIMLQERDNASVCEREKEVVGYYKRSFVIVISKLS